MDTKPVENMNMQLGRSSHMPIWVAIHYQLNHRFNSTGLSILEPLLDPKMLRYCFCQVLKVLSFVRYLDTFIIEELV
jgi:hypothetical protein